METFGLCAAVDIRVERGSSVGAITFQSSAFADGSLIIGQAAIPEGYQLSGAMHTMSTSTRGHIHAVRKWRWRQCRGGRPR